MIHIEDYIERIHFFPKWKAEFPWILVAAIQNYIEYEIKRLDSNFIINDNVAIHKTAKVEEGVVLKGPVIISENCFIGAHAYLRGGVFLDKNVSIGPGCEIKSSIVLAHSALAHFNFIGDSILGSYVNMEAGSIIANHHNDRAEKEISVLVDDDMLMKTGSTKFGALVGDHSKIGANAVLSPGTILKSRSIVGRLELIRQS